jgi:uncharacterized membrane protein
VNEVTDGADPLSRVRRRMVLLSGGFLVLMLALSAVGWLNTAEDALIPVHWNASGEVDRFGSKWEAFLVTPALLVFITALMVALPAIEPRRLHLQQSRKPYVASFAAVATLMLVVHTGLVAAALGLEIDMARLVPVAVGIMLVVVGNYLGKVRSNFFIGIRTPWTLSSELSWRKTHRLGGKLFVVVGLAIVASSVLPSPGVALLVASAVLGVMVLALVVYSYVLWRGDPDRSTGGRTV